MAASTATRLAGRAAGAAFAAVARARESRPVHPHGPAFAATARLDGGVEGVLALRMARELDAVVRLSRSFDLVSGMPDLLGVAFKLRGLHAGGEGDQDLLVVSSAPPPVEAVPWPATSYAHTWYSSVLPYRAGGKLAFVVARSACGPSVREGDALEAAEVAAGRGELRFELGLAPVGGRFERFGEVEARELLQTRTTSKLAFDPVAHDGPGLRQAAGPLDAIRAMSYRASRAARPGRPKA